MRARLSIYPTPRCGGAIGLYFIVKRCSLLYLYANNGSFAQSPYLDIHGEVDISMRCVCFSLVATCAQRNVDAGGGNIFIVRDGKTFARRGSIMGFRRLWRESWRVRSIVADGRCCEGGLSICALDSFCVRVSELPIQIRARLSSFNAKQH